MTASSLFDGQIVTFTASNFTAASDGIFNLMPLAARLGQASGLELPRQGKRGFHGAM